MKTILITLSVMTLAAATLLIAACTKPAEGAADIVARGKYLVSTLACTDCHTPWHLGPQGPEPNDELFLSGHPESLKLPPPPALPPGPWAVTVAETNTAWSGPWGISYPANLTPDEETGLGRWTEAEFIATLRTGRRMGRGREILPPMPWHVYRNLNDSDMRAVFAYLRSIRPIKNRVPEPVPPKSNG